MIGNILLLIFFLIIWWYLVEYIKYFKTGDPEEGDHNYWKFSYDFKPIKKKVVFGQLIRNHLQF